eukprot:jgi/Ulvmu1/12022/UM083_0035.1
MSVVADDQTGLEKACLRTTEGTTAEVYLHGAHVVSFIPAGGEEVIFVSKEAIFKPPKAIRGGIPVCWPQFNDMGPLSSHGFARNSQFAVKEISASHVVMQLSSDDVSVDGFPSGWTLLMTLALSDDNGGTLKQSLTVVNGGEEELHTTQALHTYYRVSSIDAVSLLGLEGTGYLDNLEGRQAKSGEAEAVAFAKEVDRIYTGTGCELVLKDGGREVVICKEGFDDAVVWNPWVDKAAKLSDFGDDEHRSMVCIEPANAGRYMAGDSVGIRPGQPWHASQTIHVRKV